MEELISRYLIAWSDYALEKRKRLEYILGGNTIEQATKAAQTKRNILAWIRKES